MKNPYVVLDVPQNATKNEIIKGKMIAMKQRIYSLQDIQLAEKQLLNPSKRLIADFMYPSKIKAKRPKLIKLNITPSNICLNDLNEDAFDSLNR
jgi:hypothetical protein